MKAILTRYHGATNTRGSRISATAEGGNRVSIPYPHELNQGEDCHRVAALALCAKMGWGGSLVGGGLPNGDWCFCFAPQLDDLRRALASASLYLDNCDNHGTSELRQKINAALNQS